MEIKNINEHISCGNYEKGDNSTVENLILKEGESLKKNLLESEMFFVRKGSFYISYQKINSQLITCGDIILLPPACHLQLDALEETHVIAFRVSTTLQLCNTFSLESLFHKNYKVKDEVCVLKINERIDAYLNLISNCMNDGLKCSHFYKIKIQELVYYLRIYYSKEKLADFFSPVLTNDSAFASFVFQNYTKVKTVQQFSNLYGYSQSSFEKQFKKVFGTSAYQWMVDQKAKQIYHRLVCSDKGLAEIADEFDFSSPSQFCDFCKHFLGASPGKIRRGQKCVSR